MTSSLHEVDDLLNKLQGDFVESLKDRFDEFQKVQRSIDQSCDTINRCGESVNRESYSATTSISSNLNESKKSLDSIPSAKSNYIDKWRGQY